MFLLVMRVEGGVRLVLLTTAALIEQTLRREFTNLLLRSPCACIKELVWRVSCVEGLAGVLRFH